ncbi:hypothetical protein Xinn_01890 [Xenorhabdus innexi]|uniref:Uncharacterized protein n=1 Tax=Xenorhabdus innexi TaxID=290109 RepID=A0A2G0NN55_9GAMM|nr:hypothetical protein Xinn_01890 [Xenorhabdus innexi]
MIAKEFIEVCQELIKKTFFYSELNVIKTSSAKKPSNMCNQ